MKTWTNWILDGGAYTPGGALYVPTDKPIALDLFCGAGGFSLGFIQAGWHIIGAMDHNPDCLNTYLWNLGSFPVAIHCASDHDYNRLEKYMRREVKRTGKLMFSGGSQAAQEHHRPPVYHFFFGDCRKWTGAEMMRLMGIKRGQLDTIIGLAPKRQWIYDQFGDICMLDDDLTAIHRNYVGRHSTLTPDEAFDLVQWTGNVAALAGCFLAGWSSYPKPMHYDGLEPITMRGFINGCAMIVLSGSQLFWDGQFTAVEDYFVCALNAHFHRKAFIDNRFTWIQTDTFKNRGGQADHRTMETEARDTLLLRRYFGSAIVAKRVEYGKGAGRGMRTKVKNPFGRSLKLPF